MYFITQNHRIFNCVKLALIQIHADSDLPITISLSLHFLLNIKTSGHVKSSFAIIRDSINVAKTSLATFAKQRQQLYIYISLILNVQ